jgi:hypothetical protein
MFAYSVRGDAAMRLLWTLAASVALATGATAQAPKLDDVLRRMGGYIEGYADKLATVVAEETYTQVVSTPPATRQTQTVRSDYALMRPRDRQVWMGFRDTFEVDGKPVRDRDRRLQEMVISGEIASASRISEENARYNLGNQAITRNVNVPTVALELLHPRNRERFTYRRNGTERVHGREGWIVAFRERERPTLIRRPDGRDNPTRGVVVVDPATGDVFKTTLIWESVSGSTATTYDHVPNIDVLVPVSMSETFQGRGAVVSGEATYANYRRFQTSGRLITQ